MEDGHRVTALAPADDGTARLRAQGVAVEELRMSRSGLNPLEDGALVLRYLRHFRALGPDAVLSFTIKNNIYGALAAKRLGLPFIPKVTGLGTAFLSGPVLRTLAEGLYRTAFRGLPAVIFENPDDRDLFLARGLATPAQARVLTGSGIDLARFAPAPLPPGEPAFLLVARLLKDKGVAEYVEAARRVRARHPEARFRLLGPAGTDNRTAIGLDQVRAWAEEGAIDYLGETTDVRPFLAAATCVVLPSYREGAPRALIEAASMARPLIATDVPGCREVVEDGRTGFLCEARSADSLEAAILRFLALPPAARAAMGEAGRAKMEREFDEALVIAAYREAVARATAQPLAA